MVRIPYSQVHVNGDIILAARSGQIQTFTLADGTPISTWKHPDVEKVADAVKEIAEEAENGRLDEADGAAEDPVEDEEEEGHQVKRQKMTDAEDTVDSAQDAESAAGASNGVSREATAEEGGDKPATQEKKKKRPSRAKSQVPDRPIVSHITSTSDGKLVVAVTAHDKTIWVWEHDGQGHLSLSSQRAMPKRPSAVVIGPGSQILCADKFGDVYSLPLVPTGTPSASATGPRPRPADKRWTQPAANELTVHSKRNLEALRDQQKQLEIARLAKNDDAKPDVPDFELTLQLGHVSMLTDLVLAENQGRPCIITADRDEHIRVSRYMPQAHITETFCLGHRDFIGAMVVPPSRPELLISGGGDTDLHVWDWFSGRLLSKTSILTLAQSVDESVSEIALAKLYSFVYPTEAGEVTYIVALCEGVNAILSWQLTEDNHLNHPGAIELPGNPFSLSITPATPPQVILAMDFAPSLNRFNLTMSDGRLAVENALTSIGDEEATESADLEATKEEIKNLLYGVAVLRKQKVLEGQEPLPEADIAEAS